MRVLITGANGFIGSYLARLLVREGCELFALGLLLSTLCRYYLDPGSGSLLIQILPCSAARSPICDKGLLEEDQGLVDPVSQDGDRGDR